MRSICKLQTLSNLAMLSVEFLFLQSPKHSEGTPSSMQHCSEVERSEILSFHHYYHFKKPKTYFKLIFICLELIKLPFVVDVGASVVVGVGVGTRSMVKKKQVI